MSAVHFEQKGLTILLFLGFVTFGDLCGATIALAFDVLSVRLKEPWREHGTPVHWRTLLGRLPLQIGLELMECNPYMFPMSNSSVG